MLKKAVLCSSVLLVACGGGGGDDGSGGGGGGTTTGPMVKGQFKDAAIEGVAYPNNTFQAGGTYAYSCYDENHYFETDNGRIRVYGSTAFSETDFKVVATMVNERLEAVVGKFGMTWDEFIEQRETFNIDHVSSIATHYGSGVGAASDEDSWAAWSSLTTQEQLDFARDEYTTLFDIEMKDILVPKEQIVVCFNGDMGGSQFGEGSQLGMQVPPNTSTYHGGVGEIFTHEIVHWVQQNISNAGQNPYMLMPRWFTEGQAVVLAGQSVESAAYHHNYHPVQIISFNDESEAGASPNTAYKHYGLAYKYLLDANGQAAITDMMKSLKTNTSTPQQWQEGVEWDPATESPPEKDEGLAFTRAFNSTMDDHTGADLTIERYRTSYHDLMNSWQ